MTVDQNAQESRVKQAELQVLAASQEQAVLQLLAATRNALEGVASPKFAGRKSVSGEARRLLLVLEREATSYGVVLERGQ